jgi:MFS family permease
MPQNAFLYIKGHPYLPWLLLTAGIDMASFAVLSSLLPLLLYDEGSSMFGELFAYRHLVFGGLLAAYSGPQLLTLGLWGRACQFWSRRGVLATSYFGNAVGYVLCATAVELNSLGLMFSGFAVAGLFGANASMINSLIATSANRRLLPQIYSLNGSILSLSFILGPLVAAALLYRFATPMLHKVMFLCDGLLAFTNAIIVYLKVKEPHKSASIKGTKALITPLLVYGAFLQMGWYSFLKFFPIHIIESFAIEKANICYFTAFLAASCGMWQLLRFFGVVKNQVIQRMQLPATVLFGAAAVGFCFQTTLIGVLAILMIMAMCFSFIIPTLLSRIIDVSEGDQDLRSASYQFTQSLAKVIAPLCAGLAMTLTDERWGLAWQCGLCFFVAAFIWTRLPQVLRH